MSPDKREISLDLVVESKKKTTQKRHQKPHKWKTIQKNYLVLPCRLTKAEFS